ncbi:ATP/GTP-binding protein [Acidovorax sp.]|uniref:AAA family ATPase n=1 Tax=Acidovorax sp. TaxID=1872122 RepID=UPI0025C4110C|nr:ATP-binding protein [Acidovorax sp.]MBW8464218.1 ATP-binding protein [Acidovorax sp.]
MLLEFGFRNFYSFKEGVTISFKLDANCPVSLSKGKLHSNVIGIKGANGSGKTQILKALWFLADFCTKSFAKDPEDYLDIFPFYSSSDTSEFYIEFEVDKVLYMYELACTDKAVLSEVIHRKSGTRRTKIYERSENAVVAVNSKFAALKEVKLRSNASIVSIAHQYELSELKPIYEFFRRFGSNVGSSGLREVPISIKSVSKMLSHNDTLLQFVSEFIAECDTGIARIEIHSAKGEKGEEEFFPIFIHSADGEEQPVTQFSESSGTKALFRLLPLYKLILQGGGVLAIDEFDTHLHPDILPKILDLFLDEKKNEHGAQLIFTTHDSEVFDILGRYRIYLTNKRDNASFAVRLDEIPGDVLRNDRPIFPVYKDGKIGGVPRV